MGLVQKATEDRMFEVNPVAIHSDDDNFCGVLPRNYPVETRAPLHYDAKSGRCHWGDRNESVSEIAKGTRGFILSGYPGMPTTYSWLSVWRPMLALVCQECQGPVCKVCVSMSLDVLV